MCTILMISGNSKTSNPHRLLFNLSDKINLKKSDEHVALSNLSIYFTKGRTRNFKNRLQSGMLNLNYLMKQILYQILKIFLSISSKSLKQ